MIRIIIVSAFLTGILFLDCFVQNAFADSFIREELLNVIQENRIIDFDKDKPVQIPCNQCNHDEQQADCLYVSSSSEDKYEKNLNKFFRDADIAVSATCDQQEMTNQLINLTSQDIININKDIKKSKKEIAKLEKNCGDKKEIGKYKRALRKSERELKQVYKHAEKEYKNILTPYQKKNYQAYRKTHKPY